jgi:ABC-type microcin C transport system permease subunit YejB
MLRYIIWRIFMMVPTLVIISALVFTIIELPPGDYFESYVAELQAQGESVNAEQIEALRQEYGFDKPPVIRYFHWVAGMLTGDFGYSFEYRLPVMDVVGDRLWLTILVSFTTIIFTWLIAFPIGIYSATHQYSWGDYGLTFLGLMGIAVPNFMMALVFMYLANVWFGTSIGHLMDPQYMDQSMSWEKFKSILAHLMDSGGDHRHRRHRRHDPPPARQSARRVAEAVCGDGARQGPAAVQGAGQISVAHGAQFLHLRYRLDPALGHLGRRDHRHRDCRCRPPARC